MALIRHLILVGVEQIVLSEIMIEHDDLPLVVNKSVCHAISDDITVKSTLFPTSWNMKPMHIYAFTKCMIKIYIIL